jgi:hypothetical protein
MLKTNLASRRENLFPDRRIISDYLHLLTESTLLIPMPVAIRVQRNYRTLTANLNTQTFYTSEMCLFFIAVYHTIKLFIVVFEICFWRHVLI